MSSADDLTKTLQAERLRDWIEYYNSMANHHRAALAEAERELRERRDALIRLLTKSEEEE